jgi:hypothetical protein
MSCTKYCAAALPWHLLLPLQLIPRVPVMLSVSSLLASGVGTGRITAATVAEIVPRSTTR